MAHGKDIRIYLSDGTVSGIRTAEIMNWTGRGMLVPRNKVEQVSEWSEELSGPSVYALFGTDEETGERRAYIGYSDKFLTRIKDHLTKKDFWRDFVVFHNKDKYFNSAHARYLEARIWNLAKKAKRYILDNDVSPPDAELSRPDRTPWRTSWQTSGCCLVSSAIACSNPSPPGISWRTRQLMLSRMTIRPRTT